jgi:hypothetical protein
VSRQALVSDTQFPHFEMNGPGEKTFKQLWRELCKEGWKPRKPSGIAKDHRYVMPGVKGRLDESRRGLDIFRVNVAYLLPLVPVLS